MLRKYRDKRTERFAYGEFVKEFSGFAISSLRRTSQTWLQFLDTGSSDCAVIALASTAFALTINGEFALSGRVMRLEPSISR